MYGYVLLSFNMMEVLNLSQQGVSVLPVRQKPQGSVNKAPSLGGSLRCDVMKDLGREGRALGPRDSTRTKMTLEGDLSHLDSGLCEEV